MPGMTTIYDPPKEGLPYLVVTFTPDGLKITSADSRLAARTIASAVRRAPGLLSQRTIASNQRTHRTKDGPTASERLRFRAS